MAPGHSFLVDLVDSMALICVMDAAGALADDDALPRTGCRPSLDFKRGPRRLSGARLKRLVASARPPERRSEGHIRAAGCLLSDQSHRGGRRLDDLHPGR